MFRIIWYALLAAANGYFALMLPGMTLNAFISGGCVVAILWSLVDYVEGRA